ncbi:MAG TPA: pyridoxamine 5'-phosphate oxidase family protein [Kofleriaceae bacterium]|nr:pyridoxamine 5'-phosphate oxidase family protein [Kofleriaceae bacterium]
MAHRLTASTISSEAELRALLGEPQPVVVSKITDRLNTATRCFIEQSPFLCLATSDASGHCDVSPRGDPPGFVRILDDRTLLVPDRPGNRIADSLRNMLSNPQVAILFVLPGLGESFRVNGRATLTTDRELLAACTVEGKSPKLGILVDIEEAYTQCPKAFIRSQLWDPARHLPQAAIPTSGQILRAIRGDDFDGDEYDRARDERYARREGFY